MAHRTINNLWAGLSSNRLSFSEEEIGTGILYKAPVISNQLNGIAYGIYDMLDFAQRTGGLYNSKKIYREGNIVSVIRKNLSGPARIEQYRCISTEEAGINNDPPIINATYDENASIPVFQGGIANLASWQRCDAIGVGELTQERTTFNTTKSIKLFGVNIPDDISSAQQKIEGNYTITVYFGDKVTTFDVEIESFFIKNLDGSVVLPPNRLGIAAPEIKIKNVVTSVSDYGAINDFHALMPFGLRFEYSNVIGGDNGIFLRIRNGLQKLVIEGNGSYIDVEINRDVEPLQNYIVIPIRSDGGFTEFSQIGNVVDKDFALPAEMVYKMGLFKIDSATTYQNAANNESPLWGKDRNATSALFSYLAKIRGNYKIPQWQGAFRRNVEEQRIPGMPSSVPVRPIASLQGDAIRNMDGELIRGTGAGGGLVEGGNGVFRNTNDHIEAGPSISPPSNFRIYGRIRFNASAVVPTSHDNHPVNVAVQMYYKAF